MIRNIFKLMIALAACLLWACDDSSTSVSNPDTGSDKPATGSDKPDAGSDKPDAGSDKPDTDSDKPDTGSDKPDTGSDKPDTCDSSVDFSTDHDNCGECGHACGEYENCEAGKCTCGDGIFDCDMDGVCETAGECICIPGDEHECYSGLDPSTKGVGACKAGKSKCTIDPGGGVFWDDTNCEGEVLPSYSYVCDPNQPLLDLDCNGQPDAKQDEDKDGFTICNEAGDAILDCCDNVHMCNTNQPNLVHPDRPECLNNKIDDNCSGKIDADDPKAIDCSAGGGAAEADCKIKERSCSTVKDWTFGAAKNVTASGALAMAHAMDACLNVVSKESGEPGLIEFTVSPSSQFNVGLDPRQINIKDGMYDAAGNKLIKPREGETFVILSSGIAGDVKTELKTSHDDAKMQPGGSIPEPYRTAHKNNLQSHKDCPTGGADIYDTVKLHLQFRAPKEAKGFSFDFRFLTREYPFYVCSQYNDFFLALLTDENGKPMEGVAADANISFDKDNNPVSVNNAFFTTCANAPCGDEKSYKKAVNGCPAMISCDTSTQTCGGNMCKDGPDELAAYYPNYYAKTGDDPNTKRGGGTAWLTTTAPVKPGEIFNLDFYIWDTGDFNFDSTVIIDNFQWSCSETTVGTDFAQEIEEVN